MPTRRRFLLDSLALTGCTMNTPPLPAAAGEHAVSFSLPGVLLPVHAWLHLPRGYGSSGTRWPLVVFLHGSGERGDDLARVNAHGPPRHAAAGRDYPFVLCSPQLPAAQRGWDPDALHALRQQLVDRCNLDADRVTATGLSLGGHGVWNWASRHPADLAAIAPVCGHGDPAAVCAGRSVPVRAYHGEADDIVPIARQKACVDALRACGGRADWISYPGVGHDSWTPAYDDPELVPWLMQQRRANQSS
jgi:predicted peptidase